MSTSVMDTSPVHETRSGLPWPAVLALALALECSLVVVMLSMHAKPVPVPAPVSTMKIVTIAEAPGEPDKVAPAPPPVSAPVPHPPKPAQPKPAAPRPATQQARLPAKTTAPAAEPQASPAPTPDTSAPPIAPAPKAPAPATPDKPSGVRRGIVPLVRIEPDYPARALANNTEGLVVAHVTIEKDGSVSAVSIVQAQPPKIFDQEAIRALLRWKFSPNDGGTVGEVELRFTLNE